METEGKEQKDTWMTTEELIGWLKLGRTKTNSLLRNAEIPSYMIGRVRRIKRADVEAWLERNKYRPGAR